MSWTKGKKSSAGVRKYVIGPLDVNGGRLFATFYDDSGDGPPDLEAPVARKTARKETAKQKARRLKREKLQAELAELEEED